MKKIVMASAVVAATAMAGDLESRPAASVSTPVETREALNNVPNMSEKEKGDWQKLREERRAAREQILQDLRNKTAVEKKEMYDIVAKQPVPEKAVLEKPVLETAMEKNIEKPKEELVREKKQDEKEVVKGPLGNFPLGPSMGRPDKKIVHPPRPFNPHERGNNPKVEPIKPISPMGWDKGNIPTK